MPSVLITAFGPYGEWSDNASWDAVIELTKELPSWPEIMTRRYPVDLTNVKERLETDLAGNHDFALHLGQSPGSSKVVFEEIGLNLFSSEQRGGGRAEMPPVVEDGPLALRSYAPLNEWAELARQAGIPAAISQNAGSYLCNATLYYSQYLIEQKGLPLAPRSFIYH